MRKAVHFPAVALFLISFLAALAQAQHTVQTIAGGGPNQLTALKASLGTPIAISQDGAGNLYVFDYDTQRVLKQDGSGKISVVAGSGICATFWSTAPFLEPFSCESNIDQDSAQFGDGGPALGAQFKGGTGMAVDGPGNVYIASGCVVRKVDTTGLVNTVAGNGTCGYSGDGGPALSASIGFADGLFVDGAGNLFIADTRNAVVREVSASTGNIATVAGNGTSGYSGDGGPANRAQLAFPEAVFVDGSGNLFITDSSDCVIREVSGSTSTISTIAGNFSLGCGDSGDGGPATSARLAPYAIFVDAQGNVYVSDPGDEVIREISAATGNISTIAGSTGLRGYSGDGGPATNAQLHLPYGITVDGSGNLFIADRSNHVIREVSGGIISTAAGVFASIGSPAQTIGLPYLGGEGSLASEAPLGYPYHLSADASGNLFIADKLGNDVRKISASTGILTTVAGNGINGNSGDGGLALQAELSYPAGVAVDGSGNVYIADSENCAVREVVAATGNIQTFAGTNHSCGFSGDGQAATSAHLGLLGSIFVDHSGNLFIADLGNYRIREVTAADGIIRTVAGGGSTPGNGNGGLATSASVGHPWGVLVDGSGNFYFGDTQYCVIWKVTAADGIIHVFAGTYASCGYTGDGGLATSAQIMYVFGSAYLDSAGNLFLPDSANTVIRKVSASDGTISTVAGTGTPGFSGDGGDALSAQFYSPVALSGDAAGNLLVADGLRIRAISGLVTVPLPQASIAPGTLSFAPATLGTASSSSPVTLTSTGSVALNVSSVTISGTNQADFKEVDNCAGQSIAGGSSCTVNVTFTPTVAGFEIATLTVTDTAGTQTVSLGGIGIDFSAAAATGGATSATVTQGGTATYSLQLSATEGRFKFSKLIRPMQSKAADSIRVTIACSGAPAGAVCSGPSQPVVVTVGTAAAFTVSVSTAAPKRAAVAMGPGGNPLTSISRLGGAVLVLLALALPLFTRRRRRLAWALAPMALALPLLMIGCGDDSPRVPTGGTPTGTYTLNLTTTSGNDSHTMQLTLTVTAAQ